MHTLPPKVQMKENASFKEKEKYIHSFKSDQSKYETQNAIRN